MWIIITFIRFNFDVLFQEGQSPGITCTYGTGKEAEPPLSPPTGALGEIDPQVAPPTADESTEQPPTEPLCPEGQILDEDTNLCVLEEPEVPEEQPAEEEQPSEESDSGDDSNN